MLRDIISSPTMEMSKLWKWVQYYINNWRLGSAWTQAVLSALALSYWRGVISWSDFVRCQRLLAGHDLPLEMSALRADDLALALSQIGRVVQGRYRIDEICGFVDQGVILQAVAARSEARLLCLTTDKETTRELIKKIPEMNRLALPFVVPVRSVIKDGPYLYLVLSALNGQPLSAWLMAQYPMGLPATLAKNLLKQIYQMLRALRDEPQFIASIHPGQLFIDPDSLTLQLLPFATLGPALAQGVRGRLYQAPSILSEDPESYLGYRLIAIAYELFTGCVPTHNHQQMRVVLKNCESLGRSQKRQIESCLLRQMNKAIALRRAAMILDVAKKRPVLDATLIVLVGLFAISAITWQGMRYAPLFLAEEETVVQTIVIQQDVKDRHVNLLKAAFFTQTQQANIAGARASWQALQQVLPQEDIFVVSIGPQQLARSYAVAAERMMRQDPEAAGVLVRAALRLAPESALPSHVQALSALPYHAEVSADALSLPLDEISEEIIALTATLIEPLPPLPPQTLESSAAPMPNLVSTDPCTDALMQQNKTVVACMDTLSDLHFGPRLRALRAQQNQTLVMTQEAISIADYNQYCVMTGACAIQSDGSLTTQTGSLDLALDDIEQTVHDYNTYCLVSGLCEPLNVPVEPIVTLAPPQIAAYTAWLSEKTGFVYRLPTLSEWQQIRLLSGQVEGQVADFAQWLLDPSGQWITSAQIDRSQNKTQGKPGNVAFYLVRETTRHI